MLSRTGSGQLAAEACDLPVSKLKFLPIFLFFFPGQIVFLMYMTNDLTKLGTKDLLTAQEGGFEIK